CARSPSTMITTDWYFDVW
nr:immunoglobulin heavy chain junction region [Mus musculus]